MTNPNIDIHESVRAALLQVPERVPRVAIPWGTRINLTSLTQFEPASIPPFPPRRRENAVEGEDEEQPQYFDLLPALPGVRVEKNVENGDRNEDEVKACAFMEHGRVIVGVGMGEGVWIWRDRSGTSENASY